MKSPKTILRELHLLQAMLDDQHPNYYFNRTDKVVLVGSVAALRWVYESRTKAVSRQVRPIRRRFKRDSH